MAMSPKVLLQVAESRLDANRNSKSWRGISEFVKQNVLGDEVELAMRMLNPEMLAELLSPSVREDLEWKLSEVADRNALVRSMISQLDPDVEELVRNLLAAEGAAKPPPLKVAPAAAAKRPAMASADGDEQLLAAALKRMDAPKTPLAKQSVERFVREWAFGEEVQLALMLLKPIHVREFFAGEKDVADKLKDSFDPAMLVIQIINMLDPEVESLHAVLLQSQENGGQVTKKVRLAPPVVPNAKAKIVASAWPTAPTARAKESSEQLVFQAEVRLRMNKTPESTALITHFSKMHSLGDECTLALRMLAKPMLKEFMAGRTAITTKLAQVDDKSALVLALVSGLDPEAVDLVKSLMRAEAP